MKFLLEKVVTILYNHSTMPLDSITLGVLVKELNTKLIDSKITKISQPEKDEIVLHIFCGQNLKLLISANAALPRIHLTNSVKENPLTAPAFCMLLRKHLTNGTITSIRQQPFERVIIFDIFAGNEMGDKETKHLIAEIIGKAANLFLTDESYRILGTFRQMPLSTLNSRPSLPGQTYEFLSQERISPDNFSEIENILSSANPQDPISFLQEKLFGLSWSTLQEIIQTETNSKKICKRFAEFYDSLNAPNPIVVFDNQQKPIDVLPIDYKTISNFKKTYSSLNEAFDDYFQQKDAVQRHGEKTRQYATIIKNAIARITKKIALQRETLLEAENNEQNKICGEIILANIYKIKKGDKELIAQNYYDESSVEIKIPLNDLLNPQQNAAKYFKKYSKEKKTVEYTTKLLVENQAQLDYLLSIKQSLNNPLSSSDMDEIAIELDSLKLTKKEKTTKKKKQMPQVKPMRFEIDSFTVFVGKNNIQNDKLVSSAAPNDIWMHTKDLHSAHLIILSNNQVIPDKVLLTCAQITAYFSEGKDSTKIAVDYTLKKHIKKPGGSPPGFVTYTNQQTIIVDPLSHSDLKN